MFRIRFDNTTAFQIFQVTRFLLLLAVSVILARIFDNKVLIGQYERLVMVSGSLSFFWITGLFNGLIPLYKGSTPEEKNAYIRIAFNSGVWLGLISGLVFGAIMQTLFPVVPDRAVMFFSIFVMLNTSSFLLEYYFLLESKKIMLVLVGVLYYGAYLLVIVIPLSEGRSLAYVTQLLAIVAGAKFLLQTLWLSRRMFKRTGTKGLGAKLWKVSYPLGVAAVLGGSAPFIDSYIVSQFFSNEHFVIFQYGAKELPVVMLVAGALSTVKSGEISEALKSGGAAETIAELKRGSLRLMHFFFPLSLIFMVISTFAYREVFGDSFSEASMIFDVYLLLIVPRLLFPQAILRGYLRTKVLMLASMMELFLNLGLSLILMQFWGLEGIAIATVIAFSFEKALLMIYARRKLEISASSFTPMKIWAVYTVIILAVFLAKSWPIAEFLGTHLPA